jgi:hypothetical protein
MFNKYYILISKSKEEMGFLRLIETMNIIVEKHKEFTEGMRKAKVAFNNFRKVMGKCAMRSGYFYLERKINGS